jgi:hypothetical protein
MSVCILHFAFCLDAPAGTVEQESLLFFVGVGPFIVPPSSTQARSNIHHVIFIFTPVEIGVFLKTKIK